VTLRDCFTFLDPNPAQAGTFHPFDGVPAGRQIDYIFVDPERSEVLAAEVVKTNRDGLYPSDHFPLMVSVVFR
jgi:endonuclease/exonuclease/phosphatase family metal-dependent hydrolase